MLQSLEVSPSNLYIYLSTYFLIEWSEKGEEREKDRKSILPNSVREKERQN